MSLSDKVRNVPVSLRKRSFLTGPFAGIESGGHGSNTAPSVFTLVSSILAALPQGAPPVLAAGGITTGAEVAAFLTLGAAGVTCPAASSGATGDVVGAPSIATRSGPGTGPDHR